MPYINDFQAPQYHPSFAKLIIFVCLGFMLCSKSIRANEVVESMSVDIKPDYIYSLDLTVAENDSEDIEIIKIGLYSPFRRYSWFRVGDVIESINGINATINELSSLRDYETPWIKFRRGHDVSEVQIGLEKTMYRPPAYLIIK